MNRTRMTWWTVSAALLLAPNFASAQESPPAADMVMWVKADAGVVSDNFGILEWQDQSGNGNHALWHTGTMAHTTADFGNGTHDVIRFFKDGFFDLNTEAFRLPDITVYAVVQQADTSFDDRLVYFSNYSNAINWGYGYLMDLQIAGGDPISRMFTSGGTQATYSDYTMAGPEPGMHYITTQIDTTNTDTKATYVDGNVIGGGPQPVPGLEYFEVESASIGALGQLPIPGFYYSGDIAEILVYSSVSDEQRLAVEAYLNAKYFDLPGLEGDYNNDDVVDAADYTVWRNSVGIEANLPNDPIGGIVGEDQYKLWKQNFGEMGGAGSSAPNLGVPEPGSIALLLFAVTGCLAGNRSATLRSRRKDSVAV